jgi:hypothetical protein
MALENEAALFEKHRLEWSEGHTGQFAVIQDETILEPFFEDWETGLKTGFEHFGVQRPFLVKEIRETDRVYFVGAA